MRGAGIAVALVFAAPGCVKSFAIGSLADAMAGSTGGFARDDDPELVEAAIPFGLKTMESLLAEKPEHVGLLTGLASGFTQYAYAFVVLDADQLAAKDIQASLDLRARAKKLSLRARGYALRALEAEHEGSAEQIKTNPDATLAAMSAEDVPVLYWLAASWGLAISNAKNDPDLIGDLPIVKKIADRALALDESFGRGSVHELFISLETAVPGGSFDNARRHFERAVELSGGSKAGPYVSFAESVSVKTQKVKEFRELLNKALAVDLEKNPDDRLANVLMQRKARRLLGMTEDLFVDDVQEEESEQPK